MAANEWEVLYDTAGAGVYTLNDVLELELTITDCNFVQYTVWEILWGAYAIDNRSLPDKNALMKNDKQLYTLIGTYIKQHPQEFLTKETE